MKKSVYILLLLFTVIFINSQSKVDNPFLLQNWKLKRIDTITYIFEKQEHLDKKRISFKFKNNGKIIGNLTPLTCIVGEDISKIKFKRTVGTWKKISDTMIEIKFPYHTAITGWNIIKRVNENELVIRRNIRLNKK